MTLTVLSALDVYWRAATSTFFGLVAQVVPVLLLAIAFERRAFGGERPSSHGSFGVLIFVVVVGTSAIAELLALLLLAFPCSGNNCAGEWPGGLADTAAYFAAAAIPAALVLLVVSGAIHSGLPFGAIRGRFQTLATTLFGASLFLPAAGLGVAAAAGGRVVLALVLSAVGVALGVTSRVEEEESEGGEEHIDLRVLGRKVLEVGEDDDDDHDDDDERADSHER